ncbi:related to Peroxidase 2 [Rhynchosporium secalis]|uniref:Related to Peroxidase 2 n=1 Tax=Rhynchosporium secalis TaxID=38038 RepID=A0A1E1MW66_RHYSE|nr:related to Peroxidase 2 [Rhynchosporium secalis]
MPEGECDRFNILLAWSGLPKKGEIFFFFKINKDMIKEFCTGIGELAHLITSVTQCETDRQTIVKEKERAALEDRAPKLLEISGVNIAFSYKGLRALGIKDRIGDTVFEKGMVADADGEDRDQDVDGRPTKYLNDDLSQWEPKFRDETIHGVIIVTGSSHPKLQKTLEKVKKVFKVGTKVASITEVTQVEGHVRPGDIAGHEHFGFADGIAQPAVDSVPTVVHRGADTVHQGIILVGRSGDSIKEQRPSWALDGSFLAFRKLKQKVPEFQKFLDLEAQNTGLSAELLGAKLVGRYKSGAPVENFPKEEQFSTSKVASKDPSANDNFRYQQDVKQSHCPYAAHTRKTNPRDDIAFNTDAHQVHRIIRRGIQYGPEVTDEEEATSTSSTDPKLERGLLFACYQSNLSNGFLFIQKFWANNSGFPFNKVDAPKPGFDSIIGANHFNKPEPSRDFVGFDESQQEKRLNLTDDWVISKGGEYFFSPSISALQETFAQAA